MAHMGMSKSVMWRPEDTGSQFSLSAVGSGELNSGHLGWWCEKQFYLLSYRGPSENF